MSERTEDLRRRIGFVIEIDKMKSIFRKTRLFDSSRFENDAEHAWHLAMMALVLAPHAGAQVDVGHVVRMVLIHDLVEIDAGDAFLYDKAGQAGKAVKEKLAADRIFSLLPEEQGREMRDLWDEFEERVTPEARFAAALDRLEPVMQNAITEGYTWKKHGVTADRVYEMNEKKISEGSEELWEYAKGLIENAVAKGYLARG